MGSSCTTSQKKSITIPSRVIIVQSRDLFNKSSRSANLSTGLTPVSPLKGELQNSPFASEKARGEVQPPSDIEDEAKTNSTIRPLSLRHMVDDLEIGEHYLEKELSEIVNKSSKAKKKKHIRNNMKWDKAIVQLREKIPHMSQDNSLYSHIDLCLREFAISKSKSYEKMIKLGIPGRYRCSIWKNHLEVDKFFVKDLYENLKGVSSKWETDIKKDIHRTFPIEPYFSSEKYQRIGQEHLFNVLKALSLYFPNVGYAQSMNFLAAFLLLVNGGNELEAFWMFVSLARDHRFLLMGLFEKGFPLLDFYTYIFYEVLQDELPALYKHIKEQQIPDILWLFKWFFTIFLYSFPPKYVIRIWDFVMVHGLFSLIQISIGVVKFLEKDMLGLDTFGIDQLFKYLKGDWLKPKSQSYNEHSDVTAQAISRAQGKKGTVIVNHHNEVEMEQHNSIQAEMSELHYQFKEFNIEEVLNFADKVNLNPEKICHFALNYTSKTEKKLPDLYQKFFTQWHTFSPQSGKFADFQKDIDFYLMKTELTEKISKVPVSNEVIVSVLDVADENNVLKVNSEEKGQDQI